MTYNQIFRQIQRSFLNCNYLVVSYLQSVACPAAASSISGSKNHRTALYCLRPTPPRTASLLSGNSVLRADFFRRRLTPPRLPYIVSKILRRARARRAPDDAPRSACPAHGSRLLICVNLLWIANQRQLANQPVCVPQRSFPMSD